MAISNDPVGGTHHLARETDASPGVDLWPDRIPATAESVAAYVAEAISHQQELLADTPTHRSIVGVVNLLIETFRKGGKVLTAGNGGSAGDAQHLAAELVARFEFDRPGLPGIALSTDTSALTAIGNDYGYEFLFSRQVEALAKPGDVFIGITTSGNSKNVLKAMEVAGRLGVTRVALCGQGGRVHELAEHVLAAPGTRTARIQESHILIIHVLCALIEENLFPEHKAARK